MEASFAPGNNSLRVKILQDNTTYDAVASDFSMNGLDSGSLCLFMNANNWI